jgi:NADH dehydrogenase FAD-containing subunit
MTTSSTFVIVGGGLAGAKAAELMASLPDLWEGHKDQELDALA